MSVNSVLLFRDLTKKYSQNLFQLDTYDSSSIHTYNMTNLTLLLEPTEKSEHLRKLIVDKTEPSFKKKLPKAIAVKAEKFLGKLNNKQKQAVFKAIAAEDYLLIKGMPGTGKKKDNSLFAY